MLTVLLVTRVQNMDDHQSLAVAPFYLLGCFLCALLIANLPWAWPRRAVAAVLGVLCAVWRTLARKYKNYLTSEARGLMAVYRQKEGEPEDE